MATQFPELIPVPVTDRPRVNTNQSINRRVDTLSLEQRRSQLLTELMDRREEIRHSMLARQQIEQEMTETK